MEPHTNLDEEVFALLGDANAAILERDSLQIRTALERLNDCAMRADAAEDAVTRTRLLLAIDKLETQLSRLSNGQSGRQKAIRLRPPKHR
jgi:hypothetical protein